MGPDDLVDFSSYLDTTEVQIEACGYCNQQQLYCQVTQEGAPLGICTSCIAAERVCDLTIYPGSVEAQLKSFPAIGAKNDEYRSLPSQPKVHSRSISASDLTTHGVLGESIPESVGNNSKIGARFSREALRILGNWLLSNYSHPYPNNEEKENLARQTGLNKTQISNWVANARRRGKVRAPRSTSSSPHQYANGIDIPRRATPIMGDMSPMERWKHSPPDQEPASINAIAAAVSSPEFSARVITSSANWIIKDDALAGSTDHLSSAGSSIRSHSSNGSLGSASSHRSHESLESFSSLRSRGRRRRRRQAPKVINIPAMLPPIHTYQCTFCTETFKTKHDWQRHEKSLHLSLERWVCTPDGPIQFCTELDCLACVYCGLKNPSPEHTEQHNDFVCTERSLEEKTFYRKDHLRQHLNIVHDAKFQKWPMNIWKAVTPEIRSRCGFCGIVMNSWGSRVEHLAQHFKNGKSMADWKGDWGFPEEILRVVENGMPPYLIHYERNTLNPYEASKEEVRHGKTLEDHVKLWLIDYINDRAVAGVSATDTQLLAEAQRIVQKVDTEDTSPTGPDISWFRDLIMLCRVSPNTSHKVAYQESRETANSVAWTAQIEKMKSSQSAQCGLSIIGCEKEKILMKYVKFMQASGQTPTDFDLQIQACKAIEDVEPKSNFKCKEAVQWFKFLINSSTTWLTEFKRRAGLPQCPKQMIEHIQLAGDEIMNNNLYHPWGSQNDSVAENQIQESFRTVLGDQAQRQPYIRVHGDGFSRTQILDEFSDLSTSEGCDSLPMPYQNILLAESEGSELISDHQLKYSKPNTTLSTQALHWGLPDEAIGCVSSMSTDQYLSAPFADKSLHSNSQNQPLRHFLSDANCYGRLERELTRFVTSCLSPNNPLQHIPSDEEIQHQARWIIYDDDDPWNQTAADNAEWLARFKRDAGLTSDGEHGLAPVGPPRPWRVKDGGTGFQPPFLKPKAGKHIGFTEDASVYIDDQPYNVSKGTAERYVRALCDGQYQFPASVFCSRELEEGLNIYIEECILALYVPTDDDLRAKGREILGVERTAADDQKLLNAFKAMHTLWPTHANENHKSIPTDSNYNAADFQGGVDIVVPNTQQSITTDLTAQFSARLGV